MVNGSTSTSGIDTQMENSDTAICILRPSEIFFSSAHDELALSKERICFSDLAAETQDIICAENPAFERSTFDSWDFFIWGNLSDLEMLLQKPVEDENDGYTSKDLTQRAACQDSRPNPDFSTDHPVLRKLTRSSEMPIRIIICEL
jgi:hypothetical protein